MFTAIIAPPFPFPLLCPYGMFAAESFSDGCYTIALWSIAVLANAYMNVHFSKVLAAPATLFIVVFYFGHYLVYYKHFLHPLTEVNVSGFCLRCLGRLGHAPLSRVGWTLDSEPARRPTLSLSVARSPAWSP